MLTPNPYRSPNPVDYKSSPTDWLGALFAFLSILAFVLIGALIVY